MDTAGVDCAVVYSSSLSACFLLCFVCPFWRRKALSQVKMDVTRMSSDRLLDPWVGHLVKTFEMAETSNEWCGSGCGVDAREDEFSLEVPSLTLDAICLEDPIDSEKLTPASWANLTQSSEQNPIDSISSLTSSQAPTLTSPRSSSSNSARKKKNKAKDPSRFCHICLRRSGTGVAQVVCANFVRDGSCRKVVCKACFEKYNFNVNIMETNISEWVCPHCRDQCPKKAQCKTYERINARRQRGLSRSSRSGLITDNRPPRQTNVRIHSRLTTIPEN